MSQSLPTSISSTGYNLSYSQSYPWPDIATGSIPSTGYTYAPQGPTSCPWTQHNLGLDTSIYNQAQGTSTYPQAHNPSVFANTGHLQFWNFYKHDPQGWFKQLEDLFLAHNVTEHEAKFNFVGRYLTQDIHHDLQYKLNTLVRGQKYESIKKILTERYAETPEQQLDRLCKGLEMGSKRPSDFLAEMLSLAQNRVPRDTVISLWRARLPAQIQVMLINYKEEPELLKCADMAHDFLQQSHNINALNTPNSAPAVLGDGADQLLTAINELRNQLGQRQRSRSNSRNQRKSSPARSPSGTRDNKKNLCWYHYKFGTEARNCHPPCNWKRGPGQDYKVQNPDTSPEQKN